REPPKEPGHAIFQNFSTHAQKCRTGPQFSPEGQEVSLVATGAMQQQQCWRAGLLSGPEHMDEAKIIRRLHRLSLAQRSAARWAVTTAPVPDAPSQAKAATLMMSQVAPQVRLSQSPGDRSRSQT